MQVNHLSHLYLAKELIEKNFFSPHPHISNTSIVILSSYLPAKHSDESVFHFANKSEFPFFLPGAYGIAKQSSVRTGRELEKRYNNVKVYSVHPGFASTALGVQRGGARIESAGAKFFWWLLSHFVRVKVMEEAASTSIYCLLTKNLEKGFYQDNKKTRWPKDEDNVIDGDNEGVEQIALKDQSCWTKSISLIEDARQGLWKNKRNDDATEGRKEGGWLEGEFFESITILMIHYIFYWSLFNGISSVDLHSIIGDKKINPRSTDIKIILREKKRVWYSCLIDAFYAVLIRKYGSFSSLGTCSWLEIVGWSLLVLFWTDVHFYITHRLLHAFPWLYRKFHYVHHESHNPNVWSSLSFHPIEGIIFFSAYLIVLVVAPMPLEIWYCFKIGMVVGPAHAHLGFDLGSLVKGPAHHYLHHKYKNGNFGGFPTGIWDKLFNTEINKSGQPTTDSTTSKGRTTRLISTSSSAALFLRWSFGGFILLTLLSELNLPLWLTYVAGIIIWILLLDGMLVIFPPPRRDAKEQPKKVFVIGLSRTGTTSITEALNHLGLHVHHFCGPLVSNVTTSTPTVNSNYSDFLDGHTDIATILVMEDLAKLYPSARFIHTLRNKQEWCKAMIQFVSKEPRKTLFKYHPTPRSFYDAAYGDHWWEHSMEQWGDIWEKHVARVNELKKDVQVLDINLTSMGKKNMNAEMWDALTKYLNLKPPKDGTAFPHRYVFRYSAIDQPKRQIKYAVQRFMTWKNLFLCYLILLFIRFYDGGQCTRACRVVNGQGESPSVLGKTGNWFEPKDVWGLRIGWDKCYCMNGTASSLNSTVVQRIHPAIHTKDQWWFQTKQVCGVNGREYQKSTDSPVAVTNCGQCSKCSNVKDVDAMHSKSEGEGNSFGLTKRASLAAIGYLFGGKLVHSFIFQNAWFIGFSNSCSECWFEATRCNLQSCAGYCLFGWENPLSVSSTTAAGSKQLNSCMHCDEIHCSAYYLQSCGANRRTSGVVTDIDRPDEHVCKAARKRWKSTTTKN